jgi:tetratricopeptide (TPR) repeat protein
MKIVDINSVPRKDREPNPRVSVKEKIDPLLARRYELENFDISIQGRKNKVYFLCFVIVASSIFWWCFQAYQEKEDLKAQNDAFQATYYFEAGVFDKAIEGDGINKGYLEIIKQYPNTKTASLARLYTGISYMHQKEYDKAISFLTKFYASDSILRARAWCVIGDAYSEKKRPKQAADYYMKAAHHRENSVYSPGYLVKAAIAFEASRQYKDAYHCYQEIMDKYPKSHYADEIAIKEASRLSTFL